MGDSAADRRRVLLDRLVRTGLYVVTDDQLDSDTLLQRLSALLAAGADVVQFRDKRQDRTAVERTGRRVAEACRAAGALFIVNDDAHLAVTLNADGLHVGQDDMPPSEARAIVGPDRIIGLSVSAIAEAEAAAADPDVDHIGFGALFVTPTKPDAEPAGPDLLAEARRRVRFPIVGIGGITAANVDQAIAAGADSVAVVSAIFSAPDAAQATRDLLGAIAQARRAR